MSLTPQNLIDDARLEAWPNLREENISPAALLRRLTSLDREIVGLFAVHAPERISVRATDIPVVFASNGTGYTLTAAKHYLNFLYADKDGIESEIEIIGDGKRPSRQPAAYVRGNTIFPYDEYERDWDPEFVGRSFFRGDGDEIRYRYVLEPVRVTTMSQTLASPDEAESYIREALTLQVLLTCGEPVTTERLQAANASMMLKRQLLLHEMTKRSGVSTRYGE